MALRGNCAKRRFAYELEDLIKTENPDSKACLTASYKAKCSHRCCECSPALSLTYQDLLTGRTTSAQHDYDFVKLFLHVFAKVTVKTPGYSYNKGGAFCLGTISIVLNHWL